MVADLEQASAGDIVLLHGCCHNPTGIDQLQTSGSNLLSL
ncbi:hypothetical protein JCM19239_2813 [Vibrio variabilis]|uniref:Aminotransferase class I/classII large domain-containing protein n=1 Tax=Vibrio variabilis TaxID=990271 RepID=A0ABQ0JIM5_9VIBR|nr:hypothetical protein JCM19239_2813 [Vibrio variabilis]